MNIENLVKAIIEGLQEKKAVNIVDLNLSKLENTVCKHFIICHGTSNVHVDAVANEVLDYVKKTTGQNVTFKDGFRNAQWIVLDYFDVVVHIFQDEYREFYNLEELWSDAEFTKIEE